MTFLVLFLAAVAFRMGGEGGVHLLGFLISRHGGCGALATRWRRQTAPHSVTAAEDQRPLQSLHKPMALNIKPLRLFHIGVVHHPVLINVSDDGSLGRLLGSGLCRLPVRPPV